MNEETVVYYNGIRTTLGEPPFLTGMSHFDSNGNFYGQAGDRIELGEPHPGRKGFIVPEKGWYNVWTLFPDQIKGPIEVPWEREIPKAEFIFKRQFMLMEHNYLCAVCKRRSAVQDTHTGVLQPCWECQEEWQIVRQRPSLLRRLLGKKNGSPSLRR